MTKDPRYNQTRLIPDTYKVIHRDYLAHCFRWDHVARRFNIKLHNMNIIDVGCGEGHLLETLWRNRIGPIYYLGVDVDGLAIRKALDRPRPDQEKIKHNFFELDFTKKRYIPTVLQNAIPDQSGDKYFDLATCFEVVEHLPNPDAARDMVQNMYHVLGKGGIMMIATPTRFKDDDPVTCKNHLFEFTQKGLRDMIESLNFRVEAVYGTMMYTRNFNKILSNIKKDDPEYYRVMKILQSYFSSNILSAVLGPAYPEYSRSQMIVARKNG